MPTVQTYIAKKITTKLNKNFGTNINISRLGLNWKGEIDIKGIYIDDHHSDTLIYVKTLNTNLLSLKNLVEGDLYFGFIELNNAKFYIKTYKGEKSDNVSIFANKFNSGKIVFSKLLLTVIGPPFTQGFIVLSGELLTAQRVP